jgi:uncharacterized protein
MGIGLLMVASGVGAGVFGSLLGLGGGLLIVPLLSLGFGLSVRQSVAVSLVSVIVTSGASAGVYLERHVANLRLGMTLELFTALGAIGGGLIAFQLADRQIAALFAALLVYVAVTMARRGDPSPWDQPAPADATIPADPEEPAERAGPPAPSVAMGASGTGASRATADSATADSATADRLSGPGYRVRNVRRGVLGSVGAGVVSALFGIGGGIVKVPVMHLVMGVPLRVATATSNLMMGITASASAIVYLLRGDLDPFVAGPVAIGVFAGATLGSRTAHRVDLRLLRFLFVAVLLFTAVQMVLRVLR